MVKAAQFNFERFTPAAKPKRRRVSCETLLEAIVIAVRDNATNRDVREILKCYPRIKNKADNPYIILIDELVRARTERDRLMEVVAELSQQQLKEPT
jgi:hypothetical protein